AVVVPVEFDRFVSRRGRIGRRPSRGHVQTLAAKNSQNVCLSRCPVYVTLRAPVVFGDRRFRARVVSRNPPLYSRNELDFVVDPGFIDIVWIPQRSRGSVTSKLHRL